MSYDQDDTSRQNSDVEKGNDKEGEFHPDDVENDEKKSPEKDPRSEAGKKIALERGHENLSHAGRNGAKARTHESRVNGGKTSAEKRGRDNLSEAGKKGAEQAHLKNKNNH
jgi:hypothetical protein